MVLEHIRQYERHVKAREASRRVMPQIHRAPVLRLLRRKSESAFMTDAQAAAKLEVADHLKTILFGADASRTMFYATVGETPPGISETLAILTAMADLRNEQNLVSKIPSLYELSDERVRLLGKLHLSLNQADRDAFVSMAKDGFKRQSPYARFAPYLFTFLAKYHDLDAALNCAILHIAINEIGLNTLRAVSNLLKYDPGYPSDYQIDRIAAVFSTTWGALESVWEHKRRTVQASSFRRTYNDIEALITRIVQQAQEIKYRRLKEHLLNDANLEINQDRQTLTAGLTKFGFGKELIESLNHAEDEYRKADSKFDFKTAVDHNRSFWETLLWETAVKVADFRKESLIARQKYPVEVRSHLHKAGFFSDRFHELCAAFYGFASEQSTHQLASGREIARVVRNMNIELGLLIIKRLELFK